jgi:hypothetical protein
MQDTIVTIYYLCDQVLEALGHQDDGQCRLSSAEVMTVPIVAALYHGGNHALTRRFLHSHGYFKHTLSPSRFGRRLSAVPQAAWEMIMALLGQVFKAHNTGGDYAIDSMPVAACSNARISRGRLFPEKSCPKMRGYCASKKRYFFGFKVHLLVTRAGEPVEFVLTDGALHDLDGLKLLPLDLPPGSTLYADKAYWDSREEEELKQAGDIRFVPLRRRNAREPLPQCLVFLAQTVRQQVETAFSQINNRLPSTIRAVSPTGFVLKLQAAVLAYAFACFMK